VGGEPAGFAVAEAIRRALVEVLIRGDRAQVLVSLDEILLGLRPRTSAAPAARARALAS